MCNVQLKSGLLVGGPFYNTQNWDNLVNWAYKFVIHSEGELVSQAK